MKKLETMRNVLEALLRGDIIQDDDKYFFKFGSDRFYSRQTSQHGWEPCDLSLLDMPATIYTEPTKHSINVSLDVYINHKGYWSVHETGTETCNSFGEKVAEIPTLLEFEEGDGL